MDSDQIMKLFDEWFEANARLHQKEGPGYRALMLKGYLAGLDAGIAYSQEVMAK